MNTTKSHDLIGHNKVKGSMFYRSNGDKIGQIKRIMLGDQRQSRLSGHHSAASSASATITTRSHGRG